MNDELWRSIKEGDVFVDNDKRMSGRRLRVTSVFRPPGGNGGAYLVSETAAGQRLPSRAARIRLDRLATSRLFTKVTTTPELP